jgi:carbonic anhydrase/acetyltransferase-like protein (isoleucine patch superfamily)
MIYPFLGKTPDTSKALYIAPSADIIGDVQMGENATAWFNTTIRGDVNYIRIGDASNIQDNTCIHVTNQTGPTIIGNEVTIGHNCMIHGCTIHDRVLVGIMSTVLDKAVIQPDVLIGAGSLVPPRKVLESGYLYLGSPVRQVRKLSEEEIASIRQNALNYIKYGRAYSGKDAYDQNPFYPQNP